MDFALILATIAIVFVLVTFILNQLFKKKRFVKYIPVIIMVPFMLYNFIAMYSAPLEGFKDLGHFVMVLLLLTASLSSLIVSIIADIIYRRKRLS